MPISKLKLNNALNIIEDEIKSLEDELSYLKAAKKNIETLTAKINGDVQPKKETETELVNSN